MGTAPALATDAARAPGRSAAVRHQRRDARSALVARGGTRRAAAHRRRGRCRRRFAPHQLRHAHAVAHCSRRVPLIVIQRRLGQHLGITFPSTSKDRPGRSSRPCTPDGVRLSLQCSAASLIGRSARALLIAQASTVRPGRSGWRLPPETLSTALLLAPRTVFSIHWGGRS